jgi:hypothetical protein
MVKVKVSLNKLAKKNLFPKKLELANEVLNGTELPKIN